MLGTLLALAKAQAQGLQLLFVESLFKAVEHILRTALLGVFRERIAAFEHIAKHLYFRPEIEVAEPHDELTNAARPCLVVQNPQRSPFFPCSKDTTM